MDESSVARDRRTKWVEGGGVFNKTSKTVACLKGILNRYEEYRYARGLSKIGVIRMWCCSGAPLVPPCNLVLEECFKGKISTWVCRL